jgi:hypothetical protein
MSTNKEAAETQPLLATKRAISIEDDPDEPLPIYTPTTTQQAHESILGDAIDILKLGFPIFISSLSWVGVSN